MKILVLLAFSLILANCAREKKEHAQVSIVIPAIEDSSSVSNVEVKSGAGALVLNTSIDFAGGVYLDPETNPLKMESTSWSPIVPMGYGTVYGVNCYMVTAVEIDPTTSAPVGSPINSCTSVEKPKLNIAFNEFDGPIRASVTGSTLILKLELNRTYRFNLIGFHAPVGAGSEFCGRIVENQLVRSNVSAPYLVATQVATINSEDPVQINMSTFSADSKFDTCTFQDHPLVQDAKFLKVADVLIKKHQFPEGIISSPSGDVCYPLHFRAVNEHGFSVPERVKAAVQYFKSPGIDCDVAGWQTGNCLGWTQLGTYDDKQDCDNVSDPGRVDFNLEVEAIRWVRTNPAAGEVDYFRAMKVLSGSLVNFGSSDPSPYYVKRKNSTQLSTSINAAIDISGPKRVLNGLCAEYSLVPRHYSNGMIPTSLAARIIEITPMHSGVDAEDIFLTRSHCEAGTPVYPAAGNTFTFSDANSRMAKFYIRSAYPERARGFEIRDISGANPNMNTSQFNVQAVGGSSAAKSVKILGNKIQMEYDKCYGPFEVVLQNEINGVVKNKLTTAIPVLLSTTVPADKAANVQTYSAQSASTCTGAINSLSIGPGEMSATFFVKIASSPTLSKPDQGTWLLRASPGASLRGDTFLFNLDSSP